MSFAPPLFTALIERLAKAHNANVERRMSVVVTGLADTVRRAKAAIDGASTAASRLERSASAVVNSIGLVDDMTRQLDAAGRDLNDAVSVMTNGAPPGPLPDTTPLAPTSPPAVTSTPPALTSTTDTATDPASHVVADIPTSIAAVQNAHVAAAVNIATPGDKMPAPPATPYVSPPAVTASTIAAANAAAQATSTTPVKP